MAAFETHTSFKKCSMFNSYFKQCSGPGFVLAIKANGETVEYIFNNPVRAKEKA